MTKKDYAIYIKTKAPSSHIVRDTALAWVSGGMICVLGQLFSELFAGWGLSKETASTAASMTLVAIAAVLTACRVFDKIAKWAGGGTLIPITGFSNSMVAPAMEFKSEGFIAGMASKMFVIAGPVLVFGTLASVVYGAVLYILTLIYH